MWCAGAALAWCLLCFGHRARYGLPAGFVCTCTKATHPHTPMWPRLVFEKGVLRGGKVTNYLLEKSRVTGQAAGERCFHVMHYLLEGTTARERSDLRLLPAR